MWPSPDSGIFMGLKRTFVMLFAETHIVRIRLATVVGVATLTSRRRRRGEVGGGDGDPAFARAPRHQ